MKIGIIDYRRQPPRSVVDLMEAAKKRGVEPVYLKLPLLDAVIEDGKIVVKARDEPVSIDGAVLRGIGLVMSLDVFEKRLGVLETLSSITTVINKPSNALVAKDKWRSLLRLSLHGLPVPDTMVTENPFSAMKYTERKKKIVYKPLMGSLGLGSALIEDPDLAFQTTRSLMNVGVASYLQKFLEKPGYDYRVFVVGDRVIGAMKRVSKSSWKTNIARGAVGEPVREADAPEIFDTALKASSVLGLDYAGVDIAEDVSTGKHYILEVNAFPYWEGLRSATGVNPPDYIIEYLVEKIKK
ncbi:MAG: RimK family alpha-L-glutamate ligase [Thermosphaera sp.]